MESIAVSLHKRLGTASLPHVTYVVLTDRQPFTLVVDRFSKSSFSATVLLSSAIALSLFATTKILVNY